MSEGNKGNPRSKPSSGTNAKKKRAYAGNVRDARNKTRSGAGSAGAASRTRTSGGAKQTKSAHGSTAAKTRTGASSSAKKTAAKAPRSKYEEHLKMTPDRDDSLRDEIGLVITALICILMVLSYLKLCGSFGEIVNKTVFGLFGSFAYVFPFVFFAIVLFAISNKRNVSITAKTIYCVLIMIDISALVQIAAGGFNKDIGLLDYFTYSQPGFDGLTRTYGGIFGGAVCKVLCPFLGNIGAVCVLVAALLVLLILILGKAIFTAITLGSARKINEARQRYIQEKQEREELERERAALAEEEGYPDEDGDGYDDGQEFVTEDDEIEEECRDLEKFGQSGPISRSKAAEREARRKRLAAKKKKEAGEGFINTLMRKGMGLDMDRIAETPEYQELKASYRMTDYEMGELISEAVKNRNADNSGFDGEGPQDEAVVPEEVDIVKRELDRKFGEQSEIKVVNLNEHARITKSDAPNYFIDEDPDEEALTSTLKSQISAIIDDVSDNSRTGEDDTEKNADDFRKDDLSGRSGASDISSSGNGEPVAGRSGKKASDIEKSAGKADRDSSSSTSFNSPEQIREVMEAAEELKKNPPYVFPPIDLLKKPEKSKGTDSSELESTVQKLQSTFESFGVKVKVGNAVCGPTVTRYELYPEQGVKVKTITALTDDIKLALAAKNIRIEAPIPGKAAVGVEVPNKVISPVSFREVIDSKEFKDAKSKLTFAVGKDIGGNIICADVVGMPHMLIAGSTGSGKSVCINGLILSILYKAKPSEVRLIMIDPKRVELIGYNGIPHLLVPVVTDVKKAMGALNWAVAEMDDRYDRFSEAGVNNIEAYNRLIEQKYYEEGGAEEECPGKLPLILIIIDELNDLMMNANSKEVEFAIGRLTQLARACGIHLVLATQRPSVNVITGTIKANIPSRISFSLSSVVDSRTILDQAGAEKLLGKGDMLFCPQGYPQPVRLQGAYVSDKEIADVVAFIKDKCKEAMYSDAVSRHIESAAAAEGKNQNGTENKGAQGEPEDDRDEFFYEAGKYIIEKKKASIGAIQRICRVGFNRAARIMDQLAEAGVVGPEEGTKPRRILMNIAQFESIVNGSASYSSEDDPGDYPDDGDDTDAGDLDDGEA